MKKQTLIPDSRPVQKQQEQFNNIPKSSNFIEKGMRRPETTNTNFRQENVQKPSILQDQSKGFNNYSNNTRPDTRPQTNKTNTPSRKNYNDAELEEARESLRLLKMKNRMNQQGSKPRIENAKDEGFMDNINAVNNNYRKAFKPSVSQDRIVNNDSSKNVHENLRQNNINSVQNKQTNNTKNKENFNNPSSNNNYGSGQAQKYSSQTGQQQYDDFQGNNFNPKSNNRPMSSVGNNNNPKTNAGVGNRNNQYFDINAENDPMEKPLRGNNNMNNNSRGGKNNFDQNEDNFVKHNSKNNIPKTSVGNHNNYGEEDNFVGGNNNRNQGNSKFNQQAPQKSRGGYDGMRNNNLNIPDNEYNDLRMFNDDKIGKIRAMKQKEEAEYNYGKQREVNSRPGYGNNNASNKMPKVQEKLQNFEVEEVEDDRPAFNQKNKDFEEMLEEEEIEEEEDDGSERVECDMCGRRFKPDSLQKHRKICKKVFMQKRKKFDMKKQRVIDEEHKEIIQNAEYAEKKGKKKVDPVLEAKKKANKEKWKKQSEEFRRMLRGAKKEENDDNFVVNGAGAGMGKGGGAMANKPAEPTYNDDLTHCSICNRRYNEDAYKKHLPMCERKKKEAMIKNGGKNPPNNGKLKK